jgi:hypothetical protein
MGHGLTCSRSIQEIEAENQSHYSKHYPGATPFHHGKAPGSFSIGTWRRKRYVRGMEGTGETDKHQYQKSYAQIFHGTEPS